jgi:hypothetical protein
VGEGYGYLKFGSGALVDVGSLNHLIDNREMEFPRVYLYYYIKVCFDKGLVKRYFIAILVSFSPIYVLI